MTTRLRDWLGFQMGWLGANLYHAFHDGGTAQDIAGAVVVAVLVFVSMLCIGVVYDRYTITRRKPEFDR